MDPGVDGVVLLGVAVDGVVVVGVAVEGTVLFGGNGFTGPRCGMVLPPGALDGMLVCTFVDGDPFAGMVVCCVGGVVCVVVLFTGDVLLFMVPGDAGDVVCGKVPPLGETPVDGAVVVACANAAALSVRAAIRAGVVSFIGTSRHG